MYEMFNMGHRMEIYCDPDAADAIAGVARHYGVEARVIGEVLASPTPGKNRLSITHDGAELTFER
jgi:phosphoribosylformylglycinamidine cyclo-ligase